MSIDHDGILWKIERGFESDFLLAPRLATAELPVLSKMLGMRECAFDLCLDQARRGEGLKMADITVILSATFS